MKKYKLLHDMRYTPEEESSYWFVNNTGYVKETEYRPDNSAVHLARYKHGNCYRTCDQALEASKRIEQTLLDYHKELNR